MPAKRHFKGVLLMGRWWSIFSGISVLSHSLPLSDKMFWIRACMQCVWTGSIEIKLSTDIISFYFGTYNERQRLRRACASLHSQFSIDGSVMSSITAFVLNGLIVHDSNHNLEKGQIQKKERYTFV